MKLLYLGCHGILEYDELRVFTQLEGLEWFSASSYVYPQVEWDVRPPLDFPIDPEIYDVWRKCGEQWNNPEFLDQFDVIYVMHRPDDIINYWDILKHRRIVWRMIGQSAPKLERQLQRLKQENANLKIVRYSPAERRLTDYAGEDAMIRFNKYPSDYGPWNGHIAKVISVVQSMQKRARDCNWELFRQVSEQIPCRLFGHANEGAGELWNGKNLHYNELIQVYRDYGVYLYTGTKPASYCLNFMEAWMSGIPVVAIGPMLGNRTENVYEVHELLTHGQNGFWADSTEELVKLCTLLLTDTVKAKEISEAGRAKAIELFGVDTIRPQWEEFFKTI
jgi:glycosyltransferase involved in cell wall biosynthesis